jgi:hypothetical protein
VVVGVREEVKVIQKPVGLNTVTLLKACSKGTVTVLLASLDSLTRNIAGTF